MADHRRLHSYLGTGPSDTAHALLGDCGCDLDWMAVVGHQSAVAPRPHHVLEEAQQVVGVVVGDEALRPVRRRLGADADVAHVRQLRCEQRLDVAAQDARAHHQRIAAGDQNIRDFRVSPQVGHEALRVRGLEMQLRQVDELRPAEAVGAVGMAGLSLAGEEEDGLLVLVLQAGQLAAVEIGHVVLPLAAGMRVHLEAYAVCRLVDLLLRGAMPQQAVDFGVVARLKHRALREGQLKDRVVGQAAPVDQAAEDVLVGAEWEDAGDDLNGFLQLGPKALPGRQPCEVGGGDRPKRLDGGALAEDHRDSLIRRTACAGAGRGPRACRGVAVRSWRGV